MVKTNDFEIWTKEIESLDYRDRRLFEWLATNLLDEVHRIDTPKKIIKTMGAIFDIVGAPTPDYYPANPSLYIEDALEFAKIENLYYDYMPTEEGDPVIKTLAKTYDGLTNDKQCDQFLIDFCAVKFFDNKQAGGIWYQPAKDATTWEEYFGHFIRTPDGMGQAEEWCDIIELSIKLIPENRRFCRRQAIKTVKEWGQIGNPETATAVIIEIARESLEMAELSIPSRDYDADELITITDLINPNYLAEAKESEDRGHAIKPSLISRYATGIAKFYKYERDRERSEKHE